MLEEQLEDTLKEANAKDNGAAVEMTAPAWVVQSASEARLRWQAAQKKALDQAAAASQASGSTSGSASGSASGPTPSKRSQEMAALTERVAKKLKEEAEEKERKAEAKQRKLFMDAAREYLRLEFGVKQKPTPNMLKEKLGKACTCKRTLGEGNHRDNCNFKPSNMRRVLATVAVHRESMESQLRSRTSLTAMQRDAALDHLYGPKPPSGSSSSGGFKGGAIISEMKRLPQGRVRRRVRRGKRRVSSPKPTQAPIGAFSGPFFEVRLVQ